MSIFRLSPGLKSYSEHNSARKNFFQSACFYWNSRLRLREMDKKLKFDGTIGFDDSYLEFLFRQFRSLRLHALLLFAAAAVGAHSGKDLGYCYMIGRRPFS